MPFRRVGEPWRRVGQPLGLAQGGGAAFSPLSLSPFYWFDFSDISTLFQDAAMSTAVAADNDPIGAVTDKSGNARHATQSTAGFRPLYKTGIQNGLAAALFDGTDDGLITASLTHGVGTGEFYLAFVAKMTSTSGFDGAWSNGSFAPTFGKLNANFSDYWGGYHAFVGGGDTNTHVLEYFRESGTLKLVIDGVQNANTFALATSMATAVHRIGWDGAAGENMAGYIMELLWWNNLPASADRTTLRNYLDSKWSP